MTRLTSFLAAVALPSLISGAAAAEDAEGGGRDEVKVSLGAGVGFGPDYEGSDDYRVVPLWNLRVGNLYHPDAYVQLSGTHLTTNFLPDDRFKLGLAADYDSDYDHVEDDRVEELERPEDALHVGLVAGYDFSDRPRTTYALELEVTYDVLHGNGALVTPKARVDLPLMEGLSLGGAVSVSWASEDYMSNRFGISAGDAARSGLSAFDADSGVKDVTVSASLNYAFDKHWGASLRGGYRQMLGDAADSPIVEDRGDDSNFLVGALIGYRF